jgi:hypothetical protein
VKTYVDGPLLRGLFDIQSFYNALTTHDSDHFSWRNIWQNWQNKVSLRVVFFAWLVVLGKILTMGNLRKWNLIVVNWSCICNKSGDSVDHLLLHCKIAYALSSSFYDLYGLM